MPIFGGAYFHLTPEREQRRMTKGSGEEATAQPFVLSNGLAPVPAKLVARILRGEFVDMAELLRDNLEAQWRGILHAGIINHIR